jgi:transposase
MNKEELAIRKKIISLHEKGKSVREIGYLLDISKSKVSYWIVRNRKGGNLIDLPKSGKPAKLTKKQFEELKNHLLNYAPERYGGKSLGWTTKMAIKFIDDTYNVKYGMRHVQKLFKKFGLSLITPRSDAYKGSKLARDSYREDFKKKWGKNMWVAKSSILTKPHLD